MKKGVFAVRDMTKDEIMEFIKTWTWGTLIGVEGNNPYACV